MPLEGIFAAIKNNNRDSGNPEHFFERYARLGGVAEELIETVECSTASAQLRISAIGELTLTNDFLSGALTKGGLLSARR